MARKNKGERNDQNLNPDAFGKAFAATGFVVWIIGLLLHGMMGQPSMIGMMYGMSYMNPFILASGFFMLVVGGFIAGWLIAVFYNWLLKRN